MKWSKNEITSSIEFEYLSIREIRNKFYLGEVLLTHKVLK